MKTVVCIEIYRVSRKKKKYTMPRRLPAVQFPIHSPSIRRAIIACQTLSLVKQNFQEIKPDSFFFKELAECPVYKL